jgi:prepilin-type N-terminal cleavage/methylation domain-containing protein
MKERSKKHGIGLIRSVRTRKSLGLTMLEILVVIVIIGVLFAIANPVWSSLLNKQRLNTAKNQAFQAIRTAQHQAKLNRVDWQVSFREVNGLVQWVTHSPNTTPSESSWYSLDPNVRIDNETTLYFDRIKQIYQMRFNHLGRVSFGQVGGQLGRITFSGKADSKTKRCVIVSTLLGAMRESEENAKPSNNKYCY